MVVDAPDPVDPFVRRGDALFRQCLGGVLVWAVDAAEPVFLTSPGDAIWDALAMPISRSGLVDLLNAVYTDDPDRVAADVAAFLTELGDHGLLDHQ